VSKTIVRTFLDNAGKLANQPIIRYKKEKGGEYVDLTWEELKDSVFSFASGLVEIGMQPGDGLAILSFNRLEWIVADLGIMVAGGIVVPIYHTNTPEQCSYIIQDSGVKFILVEDEQQLAKILEKEAESAGLKKIILIEGQPPAGDDRIISFETLMAKGKVDKPNLVPELEQRIGQVKPEDLATIVYTSGTTGPPKGCLISHNNIGSVLQSIHERIQVDSATNLSLMILPISHLYPRVSGYYYNIFQNIPFAIAESLDTLAQNMMEARPTYFTSVPRIFEKVYDRISGTAEKGSAMKRLIFQWAVNQGRERSRKLNANQPLSAWLKFRFNIADMLVFRKIREALGGRIRFAVSAGAPLSAEVGEFIHSVGIQVLEFYGLTETITGTMTTFEECRFGTVGKPMPGEEVKLAEDGEILMRGNNFIGYHNKPELTSEIIKDGWCYTGDIGRWDEDGFLIITDRKKDLIITSGGKNISPQNIENLVKRIPLVSMVMVYGDNKKYLTALITLDPPETEVIAEERGISYDTYEDLTQSPEIRDHVQQWLDKVNSELAQYETIKKFVILPRDLTQEEGEITPTLKLKRKVVREKFGNLLDELYEEDGVSQF
jgi:long-chain acyl-CoA synthetase